MASTKDEGGAPNLGTSQPAYSEQTPPPTNEGGAPNLGTSQPAYSDQNTPSTNEGDAPNVGTSQPVYSEQTTRSTNDRGAPNLDISQPVYSEQSPPPTNEGDAPNLGTSQPVYSEQTPPPTNEGDAPNLGTSQPGYSEQTTRSTNEGDAPTLGTSQPVYSEQTPPPPNQGQIQDARIEYNPNSVPEDTKRTFKSKTENIKLCSVLAGKTNSSHKRFIDTLINQIQDIEEVSEVDESNTFVVFCPIVSRAGTDIESALKIFNNSTGSSKLKVLVVLHHTFDPEKTVPDSSRCVDRKDILTVDCLFYEDTGLLDCPKNHDAMEDVFKWLKKQGEKKGIKVLRKNETASWFSKHLPFRRTNSEASSVDPQNSSSGRKTGDPQHNDCNRVAEKLRQISGLSLTSKKGNSDIWKIYPVSSQTDFDACQKCFNTTDEHVLVLLLPEHTNIAPDRRFKERPNTIVVDCAVSADKELIFRTKLPAVLQWLSTELEQRIPTEGSQQHQETDNKQQNRHDNTSQQDPCTVQ